MLLTEPTPVNPLTVHDYFGVRNLCTVDDLFTYRAHMGHKASIRNPYMTPYLFGTRQGVDIINLDKTIKLLGDALNFVAHVASSGGIILFISRHLQVIPGISYRVSIGQSIQTIPLVETVAQECSEYSHCRPWLGAHFTDQDNIYGVVTRLPDLVIFVHSLNTVFLPHVAIKDAAKVLIPTVGIVDSNCDPRLITYPIPGNDDSIATVRLWLALFKEAIRRGKDHSYSAIER